MAEVAATLRQQTGQEYYVDRRVEGKPIFIGSANGAASLAQITQGMAAIYRLQWRRVGDVHLLALGVLHQISDANFPHRRRVISLRERLVQQKMDIPIHLLEKPTPFGDLPADVRAHIGAKLGERATTFPNDQLVAFALIMNFTIENEFYGKWTTIVNSPEPLFSQRMLHVSL